MKLTLVLCVLALFVAVVFGSGGHGHVSFNDSPHCRAQHGHGGHGDGHGGHDAGHGDAHAAGGHDDGHGGGHADAGHGDAAHGAGHADDGHGSATSLQMCSTLFSFAVIAAFNKLW
ncbi:antifungal protein-like [Littorina saxatilis]|uniref:antifungal protein-like n=1 Tax=Littorina saxatilis TaxID=31220 RepID=UPI0038B5ED0C